jgi:hypothetical protein
MCDSDCNNSECFWDYGDCNQFRDQDESLLEEYGETLYQDLDEDLYQDRDQIPSDLQDLDDEIGKYNEVQDADEYYDYEEREDDEDNDGMSSKKRGMIIAVSISISLATIILAIFIICRIRRNKKRR